MKALFITVDAPQLGRREKDMRMKFVDDDAGAKAQEGQSGVKKDQGIARAISVRPTFNDNFNVLTLSFVSSLSSIQVFRGKTFSGSRP